MSFKLESESPENQKLIDSNTGEVYDLAEELGFSKDLSRSLERHSANQVYWESLAADLTRRLEEFEALGYAKWFSHCRHYAKLAYRGMGEENLTKEAINDAVIRIFGKTTSKSQRDRYVKYAFHAHLCITLGNAGRAERFKTSEKYEEEFEEFKRDMLSYIEGSQPWYYETVIQTKFDLRSQAESIENKKGSN